MIVAASCLRYNGTSSTIATRSHSSRESHISVSVPFGGLGSVSIGETMGAFYLCKLVVYHVYLYSHVWHS